MTSLTEFLADIGEVTRTYSTEQVTEGLWFLAGESDLFCDLYDTSVPENLRVRCAATIVQLYNQVFGPRCQNALSNGDNGASVKNRLNSICYMWWDVFPTRGRPHDPDARTLDEVLLGVMRSALSGKNVACVESALHGRGHWQSSYPGEVENIVRGFLRGQRRIGAPLRDYADAARRGMVQ
ncbi:MAG: hypothetical protein IRY84_15410 [Thermobispora bispora]|nr:hypothetical protein [Thermobispora bispora]